MGGGFDALGTAACMQDGAELSSKDRTGSPAPKSMHSFYIYIYIIIYRLNALTLWLLATPCREGAIASCNYLHHVTALAAANLPLASCELASQTASMSCVKI